MDINIAKLLINVGENANFDWNNFYITALGALFGALSAYLLNKHLEKQKYKQQLLKKTDELLNYLNLLYHDIIYLYKQIQDNIETKNPIVFITPSFEISQIQDYIFLTYYNPYFVSILNEILLAFKGLQKCINSFNEVVQQPDTTANQMQSNIYFKNIKLGYLRNIKVLLILIVLFEKYLADYRIKGLYSCYINNDINQIEKDRKLEEIYQEYKQDNIYIKWDQALGSYINNPPNIYCKLCSCTSKIKNYLILFCLYFKKPSCKKTKCNNDGYSKEQE